MKQKDFSVTCHDIEGNTYQVSANKLTFRPAVYGVIIQNNKVLLSKQWDGYDFPGGGIELGESTEEALEREVKEETGIEVNVGQILHSEHSFFKLPFKGTFVHSIHLYYQCEMIAGELSTQFLVAQEQEYAGMPEWIDLDRLDQVKIYNSVDLSKVLKSIRN